ncbi:protein tipE-like [Pollicipes pollicipes]|uniref:protein tipE-like n=1 Tax=Pollicipes pollicipes TaxID=41117 RepID=UPI001885638F|nr:protein tipE-like [Pollicipes pollicipes]XP_037078761.1 protein tipE-like [Pollicipes pollicipes]XP_037078762.1 protein tipE-like [Pollicipes pollicipes]XP_037078763.1 protein tipE-like [Pollicipes pollicipes]XP_037078764.1 protein tipE-like [Pollicipes pollicipes]
MPKKKPHPLARLRYYVTLVMSVVAIFSFFALLFLVPFVFDPAISTLSADFPEEPAACKLSQVRVGEQLSACNWTSCSEGCTAPLTYCVQLWTSVSSVPYRQFVADPEGYGEQIWADSEAPLRINIQGCGYPPQLNCTEFFRSVLGVKKVSAETVNDTKLRLGPFPCYPSGQQQDLVIFQYDHGQVMYALVMAAVVPSLALLISIGTLLYCHCDCCKRSCPQLPIPGEDDKLAMLPPEVTVSMATDIDISK